MLFSKATMKIGDSILMKGVGPFTNKVGFIPSMEGFILHHPSSVNNSSRNDINNQTTRSTKQSSNPHQSSLHLGIKKKM